MADFRSVENARLRTSTTAASRGTPPLAHRARSTMVGSRSAGMLSATNQSRSSSDLAAVLRPAPDRPVMMTISGDPSSAVTVTPHRRWSCLSPRYLGQFGRSLFLSLFLMQGGIDRLGGPLAEPRQLRDVTHRRGGELAHRAEVPQQ